MATAAASINRDKTLIDIGDKWKDSDFKWGSSVKGADGCIYGIPDKANHVVRFDPLTKTLTAIGIDFGNDTSKYQCGVLADNGFVYCPPSSAEKILKIDTRDDANPETAVTTIDLPDGVDASSMMKWGSGDKATDGKLYFMPSYFNRILRINPNDDSVTLVGNDLGDGYKYEGTVATPDGYVYGIPCLAKRIIKFHPTNPDDTITVGDEVDEGFGCGGGVRAGDGYIYAVTYKLGGILKINVSNDTYSIIQTDLVAEHDIGWSEPILGRNDRFLYFPPNTATRVMVFDTNTKEASLVGPIYSSDKWKWASGALAPNGTIYCLPYNAKHILEFDPTVLFMSEIRSQEIHGDVDQGVDRLGLRNIARTLALMLLYKDMKGPFVLGVLGRWGRGKSFFFNLILDEMIKIQQKPATAVKEYYAGHIYKVHFNAWTFHKLDLWSSIMYQILVDLNDQLRLEEGLLINKGGKGTLLNGNISTLKIVRDLDRNDQSYLKSVLKDSPDTFFKDYKENKGKTSEALLKAIEVQYEADIKREEEIIEKIPTLIKTKEKNKEMVKFWKHVESHSERRGYALLKKALKQSGEEYPEIQTALEKVNPIIRLYYNFRDSNSLSVNAWIILILMVVGPIAVAYYFTDIFGSVISTVMTFVAPFLSTSITIISKVSNGLENFQDISDELNLHIEQINNDIDSRDIEEARDATAEDNQICILQQELSVIKNRRKLKQGESLREAVFNTDSSLYGSRLGIVHNVHQDLKRLSTAMLNTKRDDYETLFPRGDPRIVLFVDDLDRCEPEKVVEVIEALQILVKEPLFKVVLAIDPRYVCLALEKDKAGILDKKQDGAPRGMDYLEKIIQIPFRLPVVNGDHFDEYIKNMIEVEKEIQEESPTDNALKVVEEKKEIKEKSPTDDTLKVDEVTKQTQEQEDVSDVVDENLGGEDELEVENDNSLVVPSQHIKFTKEEQSMIQKQGKFFTVSPRTIKRIVNVFKIIKVIWTLDGYEADAKFKEASLLLLFLASDDWLRKPTSKIFKWMESSTISYSKVKYLEAGPENKNNLANLLLGLIELESNEIDGTIENHIRESFEHYEWKNVGEWNQVATDFFLARSFSFSDYTMAFEDNDQQSLAMLSEDFNNLSETQQQQGFADLFRDYLARTGR